MIGRGFPANNKGYIKYDNISQPISKRLERFDFNGELGKGFKLPSYDSFFIKLISLNPSATTGNLGIRISQDSGSTVESGATAYSFAGASLDTAGTTTPNVSTGASRISMVLLRAAQSNISGDVFFKDPSTDYAGATWTISDSDTGSAILHYYGSGHFKSTGGFNYIEISVSVGTILSGAVELWALG